MGKENAVIELIREARADRCTNAAATRTVKALKSLGLLPNEIISVMCYLDYCKPDGEPYMKPGHPKYVRRCW